MILKKYKNEIASVIKLNNLISKNNLTKLNFGNASFFLRNKKKLFIKGSGFETENLKPSQISICKIFDKRIKNYTKTKPSVDTWTHLYLYEKLKNVNFIIHAHPLYATTLAQAEIEPECLGTTHADFFYGKIPLSKKINKVEQNYEKQIGKTIIEKLNEVKKDNLPGILLINHGLYAWGETIKETITNAVAIECICELYFKTKLISAKKKLINKNLSKFHYNRKNSKKKYYGQ